jgi:hypothetical protein
MPSRQDGWKSSEWMPASFGDSATPGRAHASRLVPVLPAHARGLPFLRRGSSTDPHDPQFHAASNAPEKAHRTPKKDPCVSRFHLAGVTHVKRQQIKSSSSYGFEAGGIASDQNAGKHWQKMTSVPNSCASVKRLEVQISVSSTLSLKAIGLERDTCLHFESLQ